MKAKDILYNHNIELKKGTCTIAILTELHKKKYGYQLAKKFVEIGLIYNKNTVYPVLKRLENRGLILSSWDYSCDRPKKYYIISDLGAKIYNQLVTDWKKNTNAIYLLLKTVIPKKPD